MTSKLIRISKSEEETQKIARDLALKIVGFGGSVIIALEGELGAGKTTFVKGFASALGVKVKVKSPTFVLMKRYPISTKGRRPRTKDYLHHLDCYRVRDHRDLTTLDLKSVFKSSQNIVLVEWPERVQKILPEKRITIHIDHISKHERRISIERN